MKINQLQFIRLRQRRMRTPGEMGALLYQADAPCGRIIVSQKFFRGHRARLLFVDGALQSAVSVEEGGRWTLLFPYMRAFDWSLRMRSGARSALLIGGGGFVYADHFLHECPEASMDVAELYPEMIDVARRYFFLNEIERDYPGFRLRAAEGFSYLLGSDRRYDLIFNDAFRGFQSDTGLFSRDGMAVVRAHLKEDGLYLCNLITALKGPRSIPGMRLKHRALEQFRNVALFQADDSRSPCEKQNCLLIASNRSL